jgi:hypothetical protein
VIDPIDRDLQTKVGDYPWQSPSFGNWNILVPQNVGDDHEVFYGDELPASTVMKGG